MEGIGTVLSEIHRRSNKDCECPIDWGYMVYRTMYIARMSQEKYDDMQKYERERQPIFNAKRERLDDGVLLDLAQIRYQYRIPRLNLDDGQIEKSIKKISIYVPEVERCLEWANSVKFVHAWDEDIRIHRVDLSDIKSTAAHSTYDNL